MVSSDDDLQPGLHETVVTDALLRRLSDRATLDADRRLVDSADQPDVLVRHIADSLLRRLPRNESDRLVLVARILALLDEPDQSPHDPLEQLIRLTEPPGPGRPPITSQRPSTPLSDVALLTNAPGEPSLGHELRAELASADEVHLLCAFVQWHGLRFLEAELSDARDRGVPIRVVTTTYIGGTERKALDRLIADFGAEIRVQYDARVTRLHAKAWSFRRRTGFHTAYVGSSNLSRAALVDGAEWNVRLSSVTTGHLLDKFAATFDAYWNSDRFEPYRGDEDAERLDLALAEARGGGFTRESIVSGIAVRPYPYQAAILERLAVERESHDRHRNLIVAATGTGKTIMAALDYQSLCRGNDRPRLLFVAHRREILQQSLRTYREVLNDGTFGELYVDGLRPERWQHVFASVQSLTSYGVANIPPDGFEVVVVDEFHHAQATTYRRLLERLTPTELLGLTATPERGDGFDVRSFFGGRAAAELRVWDAIQAGLLSAFHYFGINDETDLRRVSWRQGRYAPEELEALYTGNEARARLVVRQVLDKITEPLAMRTLGFCASVAHAHFMADYFNQAGIPAVALSGRSRLQDRDDALARLRGGDVNVLFTVDLFNEGVDIPDIDTVLFLRPTESPTIFLQQLGRGLRLHPGKDVLTVLDFVGQHRKEYRLDLRYRALTGMRGEKLRRQAEAGFPLLPSGCQLVLDRVAQRRVLDNIRANLQLRWPQLVGELRGHPADSLPQFLDDTQLELSQVLRHNRSWTELQADAELRAPLNDIEKSLLKRVRAFTHVDDPVRAAAYRELLDDPARADSTEGTPSFAEMLFYSLWPNGGDFATPRKGLQVLLRQGSVRSELRQVLDLAFDNAGRLTTPLPGALASLPLQVHASYSREEVLAGLGHATPSRPPSVFREGVLFTEVAGVPVDAFFITLKKSEADFSPSTLYRDHPINQRLFHWQSQSTTSAASPTGQRYINGTSTVLLFVRQERSWEFGTAPYVFLGDAHYVNHEGDRPVSFTWRLSTPMPAALFVDTGLAI